VASQSLKYFELSLGSKYLITVVFTIMSIKVDFSSARAFPWGVSCWQQKNIWHRAIPDTAAVKPWVWFSFRWSDSALPRFNVLVESLQKIFEKEQMKWTTQLEFDSNNNNKET